MTCARCPGISKMQTGVFYCSTWRRPDLEPAYSEGHPLRKLPDDGGENCPWFAERYGKKEEKNEAEAKNNEAQPKQSEEKPIAATQTALESTKKKNVGQHTLNDIKSRIGAGNGKKWMH